MNALTTRKLTLQDLENAVDSEKRLGSAGFSDSNGPVSLILKGYKIVVREANRQGWTFDQLVAWVDSKYGRWFWDELYGCKDAEAAAKCVTLSWMDESDRALYGI